MYEIISVSRVRFNPMRDVTCFEIRRDGVAINCLDNRDDAERQVMFHRRFDEKSEGARK